MAADSRKVKLLCSFGGRILPRPSDGVLRYAGGHTRIISVPCDIPFPDLMARLADVRAGVGPTVVKYQLPNEDLDALISVSCPEDLDNMLDEYNKLIESDPAAKLRVFLFSVSELADPIASPDSDQRYFDAVNGVDGPASSAGSLGRKDSGLSSSSECEPVSSEALLLDPQPVNLNPLQQKPLSQLPPLMHPYQQPVQSAGVRLEDCHMCQKALPHAHSDNMVQEGNGMMAGSRPEVSPVFYSQRSDDALRLKAQNLVENVVEPKVENMVPVAGQYAQVPVTGQFAHVPMVGHFPPVSDQRYEKERPAVPKVDNVDHARVFIPPTSMVLSPDAQPQYGYFSPNYPQPNTGAPHYPVHQVHGGAAEYAYDFAKPVNGMMEGIRLNAANVAAYNGHAKPAGIPDSTTPAVGTYYSYMPQVGGNVMLPGRGYVNAGVGVVPDMNYTRPTDQLPSTTTPDLTRVPNLQPNETTRVLPMAVNPGAFPHNLVNIEPPIPSESLRMPTYTAAVHPAYAERSINPTPVEDLRVVPPPIYSNNVIDNIASSQGSDVLFGLTNVTASPSGLVEPFQEPSSSDSLFSNQDPRMVLGGTNALPPRPKRVASKESMVPKDSGIQVHLGNSTEPDIIALLEEGGLHPTTDSLEKAFHPVSSQPAKSYGDEQIKQDLKAVAEGVASSVLNTSPPAPVLFTHDKKDLYPEFQDGRKIAEDNAVSQSTLTPVDGKVEVNEPRDSDKTTSGIYITEDIEKLQIINNNDLEELRELGSGTFGTVYHGKWRGSDVAIKRINERCFAGKQSEQERMRADFWNEASKLADLHHPNVVAFYGIVLDGPGGSIATVTEYMVNGSLRNALQRNDPPLDRRKRLLIAMDVAFGMEYLHKKNIVHFDLKSDNLLVNLRDPQRPICKVGDLGLSKVKCQTLISGGVRGTLPWMAPELLNGSSSLVSEKVDVFSFGIVMWELLTGEEPYADLHYGAIIGGIVSNTLRPSVPETCDPHWRSLMEKCWASDPSERPSFTKIADELRLMGASLPSKRHAQK